MVLVLVSITLLIPYELQVPRDNTTGFLYYLQPIISTSLLRALLE
jgi:hypothetical protein